MSIAERKASSQLKQLPQSNSSGNFQRITRLVKLIGFLLSDGGQNIGGIARMCGVSRRTAFRDIEALRAADFPIRYDLDQDRYRLDAPTTSPVVTLTVDETLALISLVSNWRKIGSGQTNAALVSASLKLQNSLPPHRLRASAKRPKSLQGKSVGHIAGKLAANTTSAPK